MLLEVGLRTYLLENAEIRDLLGEGTAARIYPLVMPQAPARPTLVYRRVSTNRDRSTAGPTGTVAVRIQCDVWATSIEAYFESCQIADAVRRACDGYTGPMGNVAVQECQFENDRHLFEGEPSLYHVMFELFIVFTEQPA